MKKLFLCFLIGMCYISAFSQYKFTLEIKSHALSNTKIYLSIFDNLSFVPIKLDSFLIGHGHNTISGEVKQPSNIAALEVQYGKKYISTNFVLDSGKNIVNLDTPVTIAKSLTLHSSARGNFIFEDLNNLFYEIAARYKEPTRVKGYLRIPPELNEQIQQAQLKRLDTFPNDFGSLLYLYRLSHTNAKPDAAKDNLATLAKFSKEVQNSPLGKQLYAEETALINNKIAASAGNEVQTFKLTDINNNLFSNSSLKGQPYMIVFSATWCGPCQKQLPKLKQLYQIYKQRGFKVIYFNNDDNISRWKEHVLKNKLTWINVSEKQKPSLSKIQKSFGVYSIPTCLVINKKGIIVYNSDESDPGINHIESFIKKAIDN